MADSIRVVVTRAPGTDACLKCGGMQDLAEYNTTIEPAGKDEPGVAWSLTLCAECLMQGVEAATGFRARAQLAQWRRMRANKGILRAPRPDELAILEKNERAAKAKRGE